MEIVQIVGLGLVAAVLAMVIREQKPLFAFLIALFTGVVIFIFLIGKLAAVVQVIESLAEASKINMIFLKTILKILGIAYITEFAAQMVRDAGQEAIAGKIELAGKVLIMVMAVPIVTVIIETVMQLLP